MDGMRTWRHCRRHAAAILFGCCLLLAHSLSGEASNDLDRFDLEGSVRTVVTKYSQLSTTHQFDRDGQLTSIELLPLNQAGAVRYVYLYDKTGRLLEEQTFEPDGTVASRKLFGYGVDDQGRPSAQVAVTDQGLFAQVEFSFYDRRGLLSEEIMVTAQGVAEKSLFDVRGHLIYHSRYYQGRLVLEATHHYDTVDRLKESRFYGSDGDPMRTDRYRYDQAGRRIEQSSDYFRQPRLRKSVVTYEFDHIGNWIKETVQRWSVKHGAMTTTETLVSRERMITYY
jgi:YD repeat-containing protein